MGVGRALCVFLPFALTVLSLICLFAVGLSGVGSNRQSFYAFSANFKSLSISVSDFNSLTGSFNTTPGPVASNITAATLGLADSYTVAIWGYCSTTGSNTICSKPAIDWATASINTTQLQDLARKNGSPVNIPNFLVSSTNAFASVVRWIQITFIIAVIASVLELIVGISALCSRVGSCCAFFASLVSTAMTICVAALATLLAGGSVGFLKTASANFHTSADLGNSFLAVAWFSAIFSIASGLFWLFSICCCKPTNHQKGKYPTTTAVGDMEQRHPVPTGPYQRMQEPVFPAVHTGQPSGVPGPRSSRNGPFQH